MTTIRVHFDGKTFVPDEPVHLPVGTRADAVVRAIDETALSPGKKNALEELADLLAELPPSPNAPADGAAQHDHYLYGTPKRP
jgi:hypothetical protein